MHRRIAGENRRRKSFNVTQALVRLGFVSCSIITMRVEDNPGACTKISIFREILFQRFAKKSFSKFLTGVEFFREFSEN